jgi:hypothetical protein
MIMMDEDWNRQWDGARDAARQARDERLAEARRTGQPVPTLWDDVRALVRDLINPRQRAQVSPQNCAAKDCQSSA